jgi:precorrin-2 dehydrogenase/sirohydrochlorin ferrochelatase
MFVAQHSTVEMERGSMAQRYYPVALDLQDKTCVVIGGGTLADGKLDALLAAGARVTLVSPDAGARIAALAADGHLNWLRQRYEPAVLAGAYLVIAATDDRAVNALVAADARRVGALVNAVDDPPNCDFFAVAVVRRGDLQVAISTNGRSPAFARWLREQLDDTLPNEYGALLAALGDARDELRSSGPIPEYERWQAALTDELLERVRRGDHAGARAYLLDRLRPVAAPAR